MTLERLERAPGRELSDRDRSATATVYAGYRPNG